MGKKHLDRIIIGALFFILFMASCCFLASLEALTETNPVTSSLKDMSPEVDELPLSSATTQANASLSSADTDNSGQSSETETVSLDLRGVEITEFLKVLSKKLNKNIIPSKKVTGRINIYFNNITYKEVLDVLMVSQDLAYEKRGNDIIMVMTEAEYENLYGEKFNEKINMETIKLKNAQPKKVFDALTKVKSNVGKIIVDEVTGTVILVDTPEKLTVMKQVIGNLEEPIVTEIFELQYAKALDVKENFAAMITPGTGSVLVDERTNSIIISDLEGNMQKIRQAVLLLDLETRQVFIEAEIMEITLDDRFEFGIDWDKIMKNPSFWGMAIAGNFPMVFSSATTFGRVTLGTLEGDRFTIAMNFLQTLGDAKILSKPRIAVVNNEEAVVMVGERQAYVTGTTSQSGESTITSDSVEFVDVGVKLRVVPTINRDGYITMKIKPEISSVIDTLITGSEDEPRSIIPIIATSEAETTVKVKDGTTIMIAGLRRNINSRDTLGIPYLSKIPVVGMLFQNRDSRQRQTEIIVFLTPHIITGEEMRPWDEQMMQEYPEQVHPENKGYVEPKFKSSTLRHSSKVGR